MISPTTRCDPVTLDRLAAAFERLFADPATHRALAPLVALFPPAPVPPLTLRRPRRLRAAPTKGAAP